MFVNPFATDQNPFFPMPLTFNNGGAMNSSLSIGPSRHMSQVSSASIKPIMLGMALGEPTSPKAVAKLEIGVIALVPGVRPKEERTVSVSAVSNGSTAHSRPGGLPIVSACAAASRTPQEF
jgi:hypothetical protein